MLFIAGITLTIFLIFLLISKPRKTQADRILCWWLLCIGLHLFLFYLHFSEAVYQVPSLLGANIPLPLLHGPFLYLYTLALTGSLPKKRLYRLLHFIPASISLLYLVPVFYMLPAAKKADVFKHSGAGFETFMLVNWILIMISGITYITLSSLALRRHLKNIHDQFSYEEKINLRWVQYLIYGIAAIWLVVWLANDEVTFAVVVAFVFFIGYFGIKQVGIFGSTRERITASTPVLTTSVTNEVPGEAVLQTPVAGIPQLSIEEPAIPENKKKYNKSGLTIVMTDKIAADLQVLMQQEKLYKDNELTLQRLADTLQVHPNYLSQVINEQEEKNFYDYINSLRIGEFIRLSALPENKQYTILSLAMDCGFNSKSSFNKYFKKVTGLSPSEYLQKIKTEETSV